MKAKLNISYIQDGKNGLVTAWIKEYPDIVTQGPDLFTIKQKLLEMLVLQYEMRIKRIKEKRINIKMHNELEAYKQIQEVKKKLKLAL